MIYGQIIYKQTSPSDNNDYELGFNDDLRVKFDKISGVSCNISI